MALELEQKFSADPALLASIQEAYPGAYDIFQMKTTYFDTSAGDLGQRRWTLRRRQENDTSVCTLKVPAGALARGEFEVECDSIEKALPELAALSGKQELLEIGAVRPTCGAAFTRQAKTLTLPGCTVELALDQGQLLGGGKSLDFAEVEVEYKDGSVEAMLDFCRNLAEAFRLTLEPKSKFARARALAMEVTHGI